ncbi:hypothetical protein GP486_000348 [Trichoglossum hirsutum]|uniref:VOC domain-containing protein n=1 Tax=Trichoglossum hirsutum TaxID=265104 RepID=A0A9P8RTM7_9PEZI|nr:hypothetical protein GP486_000348 [Trichoglossum hirsutum]
MSSTASANPDGKRQPRVRIDRLAHVHYQHPSLERANQFFKDFGFIPAKETSTHIYYRGFGSQPFIYVAEQSPTQERKFVGACWVVVSLEDLQNAATLPGASKVLDMPDDVPGGGKFVVLKDPNGFGVMFVYGQTLRDVDSTPLADIKTNTALTKVRKGQFRRYELGPSRVHKLGHFGLVVKKEDFKRTVEWYTETMALALSDAVYDPKTGEDQMKFFHVDKGLEWVDHHSFFLATAKPGEPAHIHHSSFEVDDMDTQLLGHDWLEKKGWTNCWGIGRHVLGSQIFDYWFDASGNIVEHYADGDLVNSTTPASREAAAPNTIYIWGPNVPLAFLTGKIEDVGRAPSALTGQPAAGIEGAKA